MSTAAITGGGTELPALGNVADSARSQITAKRYRRNIGWRLLRDTARSGGTQCWSVAVVVPVWWCLLWRFVADGPKRRKGSWVLWPALKLGQFLPCCARGWSKLGASDRVHSFSARSLGQWHRPSWNCLALGVPMVYVLFPTRWNGTSGTPAWILS